MNGGRPIISWVGAAPRAHQLLIPLRQRVEYIVNQLGLRIIDDRYRKERYGFFKNLSARFGSKNNDEEIFAGTPYTAI